MTTLTSILDGVADIFRRITDVGFWFLVGWTLKDWLASRAKTFFSGENTPPASPASPTSPTLPTNPQ